MNCLKRIIAILILVALCSCGNSSTETISKNNYSAISDLLKRLSSEHHNDFIFKEINSKENKDIFEIVSKNGKIEISGNNQISIASGLNWYLRYYCHIRPTWSNFKVTLPKDLPEVKKKIRQESTVNLSYYLNYCTYNYTMSFWDWQRWEKEIDWMALNGVNLPLAIVGTTAVWQNTLKRLNYTDKEIKDFLPGPVYNAWWLMGNMEGWGGPLPQSWIDERIDLQRKILDRMRSYGMQVVVPGFYGMVPHSFKQKFPQADIKDQGLWAGGFERPSFLSPTDSLFTKVASIFYDEQQKLYGNFEHFSGDPFHEGGSAEDTDLSVAGKNIFNAMREYSENPKWVLQAWSNNPKDEMIKNIDPKNLLILDLDANNFPQWEIRNGWNDVPFVWNIISNFGGNIGLFGRLDATVDSFYKAKSQLQNLKGIGAMPEGIENNPIIYELLFELRWHNQPINLDTWINDYAYSRYQKDVPEIRKAWQILRHTIYGKKMSRNHSQHGTTESIFCARPALTNPIKTSTWGTTKMYYKADKLLPAWELFIKNTKQFDNDKSFEYDLVDLTRQVLTDYGQWIYHKIKKAYNQKNIELFTQKSNQFLELIKDQDRLLNTKEEFMLGPWIHSARNWGKTKEEKDLYEFNARTLITTWSFQDSNLHDYSHREWGGMLKDFYLPRWEMYFTYLKKTLEGENPSKINFYPFEKSWNRENKAYPITRQDEPIKVVKQIYVKYANIIKMAYKKK